MEGQVSKTQSLQEGDLVLGRTFGYDKLKPDWEGPLQSSMMNQRALIDYSLHVGRPNPVIGTRPI